MDYTNKETNTTVSESKVSRQVLHAQERKAIKEAKTSRPKSKRCSSPFMQGCSNVKELFRGVNLNRALNKVESTKWVSYVKKPKTN